MSTNNQNIYQIFAILIQSAFSACQIIQKSSHKLVSVNYKQGLDPVTQIDHTIQKFITNSLSHIYSTLNIVGQQHIDQVMVDYSILNELKTIDKEFQFQTENQKLFFMNNLNSINIQDLCIFIDPLDCTRGYVCGKKWECTVIIGVTVKGVPTFGIIAQPFYKNSQNQCVYNPKIIVGSKMFNSGAFYEYQQGNWLKQNSKKSTNDHVTSPKFAVSSRRTNQIQQGLLNHLSADAIYCGGSGNKLAMLIRQQVDAVIFLQCPTSTWDSCAGQAIILALKGYFTKPDNTKIQYSFLAQDQTNYQGFFCCLNQSLFKQVMNYLLVQ